MAGLAVEATLRALKYYGPSLLTQLYWEANAKPKAKWLPRLQAAPSADRTGSKDPHVAGRALDIVLFAKEPTEKNYADRIVQVFLSMRSSMGFISVVYNDWEWNGSGSRFPHIDAAHKTHIHIEWSGAGVSTADFGSDLENALYSEFSSDNFASGDYASA